MSIRAATGATATETAQELYSGFYLHVCFGVWLILVEVVPDVVCNEEVGKVVLVGEAY